LTGSCNDAILYIGDGVMIETAVVC